MLYLRKLAMDLLKDDPSFNLIRYVNAKQGFALGRIDFEDAAREIRVSPRTVGRIVRRLADEHVLVVSRDKLRISEEYGRPDD